MLEIPIHRVRVRQAIAHLVYYFTTKTKTHTSALPVSQRNPFLSLHSELSFCYWTRFVLPGCTANQNAEMPRFAAGKGFTKERAGQGMGKPGELGRGDWGKDSGIVFPCSWNQATGFCMFKNGGSKHRVRVEFSALWCRTVSEWTLVGA